MTDQEWSEVPGLVRTGQDWPKLVSAGQYYSGLVSSV